MLKIVKVFFLIKVKQLEDQVGDDANIMLKLILVGKVFDFVKVFQM